MPVLTQNPAARTELITSNIHLPRERHYGIWKLKFVYSLMLNSSNKWGEWPASRPGRLILWEGSSGMHCIGGLTAPKEDLGALQNRKTCFPAGNRTTIPRTFSLSWSLYQLSYFGSPKTNYAKHKTCYKNKRLNGGPA
jgi:hypothetical protein